MNYAGGNFGQDFQTSFTIPKTKGNIENKNDQLNPVLANAYGNIAQSSTFQYPNYNSLYQRRSNVDADSTEIPKKRARENAYPVTVHVTPANTRYKDSFGDLSDSTLPKELLKLFQPLFCKLCMFQLTSNIMAKMHYGSRNHDKKVRIWLLEYSEQTGEPLHKRATMQKIKKPDEYDPKYYHCGVCDLPLTGKIHAESHYMGKNHQRAVHNQKDPAGAGFYSEDGKWVRTVTAKKDSLHGDGFGQDFNRTISLPTSSDGSLRCELCDVSVTSVPQLEMHLKGTKHKKRVKRTEAEEIKSFPNNEEVSVVSEEPPTADSDSLAIYRTPSGQFYCKCCNLSLNSEMQFVQHLNSKKHAKKAGGPVQHPAVPQSADDIFLHL